MSTPGFSAAGHCWATQNEAIDAHYSALPTQFAFAADPYNSNTFYTGLLYYSKTGSVWYQTRTRCSSDSSTCTPNVTTAAPTNVVGSCTIADPSGTSTATGDPVEAFVDGHILGWGVALAMAAAWGVNVLRRAAT